MARRSWKHFRNKRAQFRSYSWASLIQSARASYQVWRDPAATSPGSAISSTQSAENGGRFSQRPRLSPYARSSSCLGDVVRGKCICAVVNENHPDAQFVVEQVDVGVA